MIPRRALIVKTRSNGGYTDGKWVGETSVNGLIMASVQPLTAKQKQTLPEGRKNSASFRLFSADLLNTVEEQNPDIVVIDDQDYEVHSRAAWQNNIINHFEYVVIKI